MNHPSEKKSWLLSPLCLWFFAFLTALALVYRLTPAATVPLRVAVKLAIFAGFIAAYGVHAQVVEALSEWRARSRGRWMVDDALVWVVLMNFFAPLATLAIFSLAGGRTGQFFYMSLSSAAFANLLWVALQPSTRRTRQPAADTWVLFFYAMLPLELFMPGVSLVLAVIALVLRILSFVAPGPLGELLWYTLSGIPGVGLGTMFLFFFPRHRRLGREWFPSRLPVLPARRRGGMTLIELLIDIAIIWIVSLGVTHVVSATHRAQARQEDGRAALELIENEFALLRAQGSVPELGTHPVDPVLTRNNPLAPRAEVEVKLGPSAHLREVWVRVRLAGRENARDVALAALLPAAGDSLTTAATASSRRAEGAKP